jgi:hypothetical protein
MTVVDPQGASPVHSQRRLIVAPAEPAAAVKLVCIALSFNGRTSDSDSLDRGSNPWGATKNLHARLRGAFFLPVGARPRTSLDYSTYS